MEISELDPNIKDTQEELIRHQEKTRKFKEYVQGLFIDLYTQDEFNRRVDAKIGRAHVRTPVTEKSRMPSSA